MKTHSLFCVFWIALAFLLCPACSAEEDTSSALRGRGWESELEAVKQKDISDFAKKVLEDNVITEEEAAQARSNYVSCVNSSGRLTATSLSDGGYEFTGPAIDTEEYHTITDQCSKETSSHIVTMYFNSMRKNPKNIDSNELTAHCLVKHHVVEPTYSGTDYENDLEEYFRKEVKPEEGVRVALSFTDPQRGPDVYDRCSTMSAQEILDLP